VAGVNRPISVVITDQEALSALLEIHAVPNPRILDCTHNQGRMWRGLKYRPHSMDVDPLYGTDTVASFTDMPFEDGSFDVVVFDPPHITDAGSGVVGAAEWGNRYGTLTTGRRLSISYLFTPFLTEAQRVLAAEGVVIAKIADQTHGGAYQWQQVDFVQAARDLGMTPCDMQIKVRKSGMVDPKWKNVYHVRKTHTFWIVVRKGTSCMRRAA